MNYPSHLNLSHWLSSTIHNISISLIAELESNISNDIQIFCNDRKIKYRNLPQIVNHTLLENKCKTLSHDFQKQLELEVNNLKKNHIKLSIDVKNKSNTLHNYLPTPPSSQNSNRDLQSTPRSLLQISSHKNIYNQLKNIQQELIFLDLETDGLPPNCNILSICMTSINLTHDPKTSPNYLEDFYFIKPHPQYKINYQSKAYSINKINQSDIDNGFLLETKSKEIITKLKDKIIVGYNISSFDIPVLRRNLMNTQNSLPPIQTIDLYKIYLKLNKNDLTSVLKKLNCYEIPEDLKHTAKADTDACIRLFAALTEKYNLPKSKNEYLQENKYIQKI